MLPMEQRHKTKGNSLLPKHQMQVFLLVPSYTSRDVEGTQAEKILRSAVGISEISSAIVPHRRQLVNSQMWCGLISVRAALRVI